MDGGRRIGEYVDEDGNEDWDRGERYIWDFAAKYDANGIRIDDIVLVYDDTGSLTSRILHGPGIDQTLAEEDGTGDVLWALSDQQGTVRDLARYDDGEEETAVVAHRQYDSFGNLLSAIDPATEDPISAATHEGKFLGSYTGKHFDRDIGLYYYNARWYDPKTLRFASEDPSGFEFGDPNASRYGGNSPSNATDASGLAGERSGRRPWNPLNPSNDPRIAEELRLGPQEYLAYLNPWSSSYGPEPYDPDPGVFGYLPSVRDSQKGFIITAGVALTLASAGATLEVAAGYAVAGGAFNTIAAGGLFVFAMDQMSVVSNSLFGQPTDTIGGTFVSQVSGRSQEESEQFYFVAGAAVTMGLSPPRPPSMPVAGSPSSTAARLLEEANRVPSGAGSTLHPKVPVWKQGDPASGIFKYGSVEVPLSSGAKGPGEFLKTLPQGKNTGLNAQIGTHVEGHAGGLMHKYGLSQAELFVNKAPCSVGAQCRHQLHKILPTGSKLLVHFLDDDGVTIMKWLFEHGKPKWTVVK